MSGSTRLTSVTLLVMFLTFGEGCATTDGQDHSTSYAEQAATPVSTDDNQSEEGASETETAPDDEQVARGTTASNLLMVMVFGILYILPFWPFLV